MSHIYVYSPSSRVIDKAAFKRGIKRLQGLGHEVEIDTDALAGHQRFAGDDATRLAAIHRAAASGADLAITSRGGYGLNRILADIQHKHIAKAIERGTQFVGYSDFTALQCALYAKTGAQTWAGPSVCGDFGLQVEKNGAPDCVMEACFEDMLLGQGEGVGWRTTNFIAAQAINMPSRGQFSINFKDISNATLWGGNLTMLMSLLGTPYMPDMAKDKKLNGILFIEDVAEHPYRIERYLTQLLHAGVLANQKAILFGQFTHYTLVPQADKGYKLQSVIDWLRSKVKCPVITGLPMGHVATKVMLPFGGKVRLALNGRDALLTWG